MGGANGRVNQAEKEKVNNKNSRGRVSLNGGASAGARSESVQRGRGRFFSGSHSGGKLCPIYCTGGCGGALAQRL